MASLLLAVIYLAFVSLGLPDSLLGSAWPVMQLEFSVPSSYAGFVSMTIACMTIISALLSPALMKKFRTRWIVCASILLTVIGILGFSFASRYYFLLLAAIPYGLGAGAVDSALNYYVASNYSSRVMNFLHCFYGLGAIISPNIMALALKYARWNEGYRYTALLQTVILAVCLASIPLWKQNEPAEDGVREESAGIKDALKLPGVIPTLIAFFAYCSGEATAFLWTSSFFAGTKEGLSDEIIASFGSLVFGGLMLGRVLSGIVSEKLGDRRLIRCGIALEIFGIALILLPASGCALAAVGFVLTGTGMGPVYPAIQHMAPKSFGKKYSAPVIGLQMASAYTGSTLMPAVFGRLQQSIGIGIMPLYLLLFAVMNIVFIEYSYRKIDK